MRSEELLNVKGLPGRPIFFIEEVIATREMNNCSVLFF